MSIKQHTDKKLCHRKHIARVLCLKIPLFVSSKISARVGEWSTLKNFPHIQFEHRGYSFPYCVACAHVGVPVNSGDAGAPPLRKREWWLLPTYPSTCFTVPNFFALDQSGFRNYGGHWGPPWNCSHPLKHVYFRLFCRAKFSRYRSNNMSVNTDSL